MLRYLLRRLTATIPVVLLISLLVFLLIHAAPGDPADLLLSDEASAHDIAEARHRWGLDQPIYVQYLRFLANISSGDLGMSFRYADPVIGLIGERLPATIELAIASMLIAIIARRSARRLGWRQAEFLDRQSRLVVRLLRHFDAELLARHHADPDRVGLFQLAAVVRTRHLRRRARAEPGFYILQSLLSGNINAAWDGINYIIMPAIALGTGMMGIIMRVTRSSVTRES